MHKDDSSRPQVIYKEQDPFLYKILKEYGKLSGVECLINTSLNTGGKPICNTEQDLKEFNEVNKKIIFSTMLTDNHIWSKKNLFI